MKHTKWYGNKECDFCRLPVGEYLIDGATSQGPWATMCQKCFNKYGLSAKIKKFGTGLGQLYKRDSNGDYIKIEG